jgi:preprotein translocase subunit SecG
MTFLLAKVPFIMMLVGFLWFLSAILLILLILIQKGKGGGLGAAFGGAGSNSLLGTKTGDFLTWVTIGLTVVFLFVGVVMAKFYKPVGLKGLEEEAEITAVDTSTLLEDSEAAEETADIPAAEEATDQSAPAEDAAEQTQDQAQPAEQPKQPAAETE